MDNPGPARSCDAGGGFSISDKKTISIATDPAFLDDLSDYLEVLSNPIRLTILKFIEHEPKEITEIAACIGSTYQNTKKHLDRLLAASLVIRGAGFGRETERGIAPVWKYSLVPGGMENLVKTLGIFSSMTVPLGYNEIRGRIRVVQAAVFQATGDSGPLLYLLNGSAEGRSFLLKTERVSIGRADPGYHPGRDGAVVLPVEYRAVTRVSKPHAALFCTKDAWQIEDSGSTGGTYLNSVRLEPLTATAVENGDLIDLAVGAHAARFLFIAGE
jgi:DNA-binding transcriptional ArsR family regulator